MHDHRKPFPPPPPYGPHPPQPLPPDYPHFIPGDYCRPPVPAMPPVPSVVEGESLYEAVNNCIDRVNVCMDTYNSVMAECYKTLHNLQRAAEENGAYYGPADVWTEEGYDADSSAKYFIIHKRHVDRRGQPIFMELGLAYDNATNSKIEQSIFSASKVKYADKIVVAQPKTEKGWYGKAIWHGAPIQADPAANLWTVGFTKGGFMRVYSNGTGVDTMLADTVFNAMGCSGVLIQDGALTSEMYYNQIPDYNKQTSRVIMGQNIATGEVMILVTGHENDVNAKGMTSTAAAEILRQRGVTLAVELCEGESAGACDKGQLMFTPENDTVPTAYCFWYITRRRFYKNDYERELAELTQNYGQSIWQGYLNGEKIQDIAADLAAEIDRAQNAENNLDAAIKAETARAQAAESQLDTKIEAETERALAAEKVLDNKITAETERATAEEARLDAKIDAETERATGVEADLQQQITNEVNRATEAENTLDEKITAETNRAQAREDELDEKIQDETNRATLEEGKLNTKIDTESQRAKDAEAVLQTNIDNEQQARQDADTALGARIDSLSSDVTQQINDFKTEVNQKIDDIESTVNNLKTTVDSLGEQVTQLGNNVTTLSGTVNQIQQTVNTLQENYTSLSSAVSDLNDQIDKMQSGDLDLPYLKRGGDTGTGTFNFTGATVNVAAPTADANAATKKYVDDADKVNAAAIAAETERATNKENELNTAITTEKERAEAAESSLSGLINQETTDRKAADNALEAKITQEVEDRTEADTAIKQEIANLTNGTTAMPYVKKSGDTMTGALNLPAPTENANAANKKYVDDADAVLNAAIQAETNNRETAITGVLQQIQELETGIEGDLTGYLPLTGGNMTGNVSFGNTHTVTDLALPVNNADAANKKYVDDAVQNATAPELTGRVEALETSQAQQDTEISNLKNGTTALPYIKDTGDTVTGTYDFTGADLTVKTPTADASPATKAYVDNAVENSSNPELESKVEALETSQAQQDTKITNIENGTTALPYLKNNGDTSSGTYNFTGSVSVPVPSQAAQAVNKQYTDSAISTAVDDLKEEIGLAGPTGHMVFVDTIKLPAGSNKTVTREAETDYLVTVFMPSATSKGANLAIVAGDNTAQEVDGVTVTPGASNITVAAGSGSYTAFVTIYKYFADGEQPKPNPTTFFTELNPPVILSATTNNPQTVDGDLSATLSAMIAAQSNWFKYKMQDGNNKTYYVMSASEIQPSDSSAANVLYCTDAGTWYQGETLNLAYGKYGDILISAYYPNFEIVSPGTPNSIVGTFATAREAVTRLGTDHTFIMAANNAIIRLDNNSDFKNILDNYMQIGTVYTDPDEYHDLRATLFTNGSDSAKPENLDIPSIGPWSDAANWRYKKTY